MSNQEAITLLRNLEDSLDSYCGLNEKVKAAFRMAIEALSSSEFPNDSDLISRQAAISLPVKPREDRYFQTQNLDDAYDYGWRSLQGCIEKLPAAQPEIIRCKDCMHNGSFDTDCPIGWNGKEYCSFAERWGE